MADGLSLQDLLGLSGNATTALQQGLGAYLGNQQTQQQMAANVQTMQFQAQQQQAEQARLAALQDRQKAYQSAVGSFIQNPSAQGAADLQLQFPEQAKAIQQSWESRDAARQQADLQGLATVYSYVKNGQPDAAKASLQQRLDADKAAGRQEPMVQHLLDSFDADPTGKHALGMSAMLISLSPDGDKFAKTLGALTTDPADKTHVIGAGGALVDDSGHELYRAATAPKFERITNADGSQSLVQVGGGGPVSSGGAPRSAPVTGQFIENAALSAVPGVTVTSRGRTPEHNAAVGGVPNSYHLTNQARDFTPPAGMSMEQLAANLRQAMPGMKVLNEGNHVHVQPLSRQQVQPTGGNTVAVGASGTPSNGVKVLYTSKPSDAGIDAATVKFYGDRVAAGGDLPPLGMGKEASALRRAILGYAAQKQMGQGMTGGDSNLLHADVKTATQALGALQKTRNALDQNIAQFDGNVQQVRQLAPKGVAGGVPLFNRWVQAGRTGLKGDPDVSKFNVAINAVANENAKIMSGASGGQVSTDSARHEAMSLINNAQTLDQLNAVLNQMSTDSKIRIGAMDEREHHLKGVISGRGNALAPSSQPQATPNLPSRPNPLAGPPAGATRAARNPKTGQTLYLVNGKWVAG